MKNISFIWLFFLIVLPGLINAGGSFILMTTLYNETNQARRNEYIECLQKNFQNLLIEKIHILYDTTGSATKDDFLPYLQSLAIDITTIQRRATYQDFFEIANKKYTNNIVIIANADIYFDDTIKLLKDYDLTNKLLALTRWQVDRGGKMSLFSYGKVSQDTWIFKAPITLFEKSDFPLGLPGCENALAFQASKADMQVINPSRTIKTYHLHQSEKRNYTEKNRIRAPYLFVPVITLSSAPR